MNTRRSFLSSFGSWAASLPILSAWLARPVEAAEEASYQRMKRLLEPTPTDIQEAREAAFMIRTIRWVPVSERLPELTEKFGSSLLSEKVLMCAGETVIIGRLSERNGGRSWIYGLGYGLHGVTHWAELPAPPEPAK